MAVLKKQVIQPIVGLDFSRPGDLLDFRSASNAENVEVNLGVVRKRQGSDEVGSSLAERILGMAELEVGIQTYLLRVGLTKVELLNKSTGVWASVASSALTASADEQVSFAFPLISAVKTMVFTNGVDPIRKFNGSGNDAALGGSPPKARFVCSFGPYLVLAYVFDGGNTYYTRVQWCDTGLPETWSGGNAGSQELNEDSSEITGIKVWGDFVSIHKETSIYLGQLVTTSDVFRFSRKETGSGTLAHGSIQNLPTGEQIFLSREGIRLFNGVTAPLIDAPVNEELRDSINPTYGFRATSVLVRDIDEYWVGVPIGDQEEPETIYKYNYRTGQVYKDTRPGLMSMTLFRNTDQEDWDSDSESWDSDTTRWDSVNDLSLHKRVMFGFEDGVTTERTSSANDDGSAIDGIWDSKDFNILDLDESQIIGTMVRWDQLEIWAKGSNVTVYYSTDSGTTWTLIGTVGLDSDYPTDDAPDFLYFDVFSSKIRFRFRNNTVGETFSLKQFWIGATPREVRM